jgi:dihydroorotase
MTWTQLILLAESILQRAAVAQDAFLGLDSAPHNTQRRMATVLSTGYYRHITFNDGAMIGVSES